MKQIITLILISTLPINTSFAEEAQRLEKIVVTPSRFETDSASLTRSVTVLDRETIEDSGYSSIADIIGEMGAIDVRRRGVEGVQADISIRGTGFEQNTVMIDGVKINDPQTGHHDMDLPLTMGDVERIEILRGPASSLYGPNSFGGVINIITKRPAEKKITVNAAGGSFDYYKGGLSVSYPAGIVNNRFSFEERRSTGYMPETEFNTLSVADKAVIDTDYGSHSFLFGYTKKDFGADSFYSNLYPNEEEHTDTRFFNIESDIEKGDLRIRPKIFLKRHRDKFALDRNRPGWQTNYHTTYTYGGDLSFVLKGPFMDTAYGFEISRDTIDSTNTQGHSNTKDGIYLELLPHLGDYLHVDIGMREDYFSNFGWEYSPSISARYRLLECLSLRSAIGKSYRIPTFTDLYYNDVANIGNPNLRPESSWSYEIGADYKCGITSLSAAVFHRNSYDTIDWTRVSSRDPWRVSNTGTVDTNGLELEFAIIPKMTYGSIPIDKIFLNYVTLDSYRKHDYLSKYALDYLKQHISCGLEYTVLGFRNLWVLNYKKRIGDSGFLVVDTRVRKEVFRQKDTRCDFFFEISNVFDTDYSEQSDISMPGRWIKSGARFEF